MSEITVHDFDIPRLLREDRRQFGYLCNYVGNHKPELFGLSGPKAMYLSTRDWSQPNDLEGLLKAAEVLVEALRPKSQSDRATVLDNCRLALFPAPAEVAPQVGEDPTPTETIPDSGEGIMPPHGLTAGAAETIEPVTEPESVLGEEPTPSRRRAR